MTRTLPDHPPTTLEGSLTRLAAGLDAGSAVDLDRIGGLLRFERRAAEAVAARLHVLDLAISSPYPISVDAADEGLTDAIAQLRQADLLRAVLLTGCAAGTDPDMLDTGGPSLVPAEGGKAVADAVGDLRAAVEAIGIARQRVAAVLADAHPATISSGRRSALTRLVGNAIPLALLAALG